MKLSRALSWHAFITAVCHGIKIQENDINELLSTPNSGLNSFQKAANGDLFILGTDLIYRMRNRSSKLDTFELPSSEFSVTQCQRFGRNDCHNYLQSIVEIDQKTFVCGTDSGNHNCFDFEEKSSNFHSSSLSQGTRPNEQIIFGERDHKNRIISAKIERNDQMSIQMSQFDRGNHKMTKIRETHPDYFKETVKMVATLDFENRNLMIGKRWDSLRNSWTAFVTSVCTNDPGHVTDPNRFISTHSLDLTCCINDFCLTEIVSAVKSESMNGSLLVLFVDQRSNSAICEYSKDDLISSFVSKSSRKNALNLANCENYENLEGRALETMTVPEKEFYINLSNKASKSPTWTSAGSLSSGAQKPQIKQNAIISRNEKVIDMLIENADQNSDAETFVLIYPHQYEKFSITKGQILRNIEVQVEINEVKDSVLHDGKLYILRSDGTIKTINVRNCNYYSYESLCLTVGDISCAWDPLEHSCVEHVPNSKNTIQSKNQVELELVTKSEKHRYPLILSAYTGDDIFDDLVWYSGSRSQSPLVGDEVTEDYSFSFKKKNQRAELIVYKDLGLNSFNLDFNIRNQTVKRVIFELETSRKEVKVVQNRSQVPRDPNREQLTDSIQPATTAGIDLVVLLGIVSAILIVCLIFCIFGFFYRRRIERQNSMKYHRGQSDFNQSQASKQASILDSEASFCIVEPEKVPYYDNYDNSGRIDHILQSGGVKKISSRSACDGDSFKSDYMSCSSSKLSSDSDQVANFATGNSDDAIVVYPNGTIGRLKMSKLKLLKGDLNEIKPESEEEKILTGTLKRTLKRKL